MDGRWAAARDGYAAAVPRAGPPAELGLAEALMWLGDTDGSVEHCRRAYAGFRRASEHMAAGEATMFLYFLHRESLGNVAVARGWMGRLQRLVEEHDLVPLRGWALLLRAHDRGESGDAEGGMALLADVLDHARRATTSTSSSAPSAARVPCSSRPGGSSEGLALLDEAMAGSLGGEALRLDTVVFASCCTITPAAARPSSPGRRSGSAPRRPSRSARAPSTSTRPAASTTEACCSERVGGTQAEAELTEAIRIARSAEPTLFAEALARMAELRLAQGRVDEAAALLAGSRTARPRFPPSPACSSPAATRPRRRRCCGGAFARSATGAWRRPCSSSCWPRPRSPSAASAPPGAGRATSRSWARPSTATS